MNDAEEEMKIQAIVFSVVMVVFFSCGPAGAQDVQSGYVNVGPDRMYYETAGTGPVLILIHDGVVHSEIWDEQFAVFAKDYKVIRYDRRGYGKSSVPTVAYSHVEDLKSLFDQLNIERASLAAMSSGGRMAVDFTLQYPAKVGSLILVGAVVGGFPYTKHAMTRGGHQPADLKGMEQIRAWIVADDPYEIYAGNAAAKEKVKALVRKYPHREGPRLPEAASTAKPSYLRLGEIQVPTLILVGEFDTPDNHANAGALNAGIANSKRDVIFKSGHLIPIEQPALFNEAVMTFLKGLS
jgi:3-oxoadipate enol-lactonase